MKIRYVLTILLILIFAGSIVSPVFAVQSFSPHVYTSSVWIIGETTATLRGFVNPNNEETTAWFEWGASTPLGLKTAPQTVGNGYSSLEYVFTLSGLEPGKTYYYRARAENALGESFGDTRSFTTKMPEAPKGFVPGVFTNFFADVDDNSATFHGSVNPEGNLTTAWFEWGRTPSFGNTTIAQNMGAGRTYLDFSFVIEGLQDDTAYYYRAVAKNDFGTVFGSTKSFRTKKDRQYPSVLTESAFVTKTTATLRARVTPNNLSTRVWFEYGKNPGVGEVAGTRFIGNGATAQTLSWTLTNLEPGTLYYYRAVAENSDGRTEGRIVSFTTSGDGMSPVRVSPPVAAPPPPHATPFVPAPAPRTTADSTVLLSPSIQPPEPAVGEELAFTIEYVNTASRSLRDATLTVILPREVVYQNGGATHVQHESAQITFPIGTIEAKGSGSVSARMRVKDSTPAESVLVFTAVMEYRDASGTYESSQAYFAARVLGGLEGIAALFGSASPVISGIVIGFILAILWYRFAEKKRREHMRAAESVQKTS